MRGSGTLDLAQQTKRVKWLLIVGRVSMVRNEKRPVYFKAVYWENLKPPAFT